MSSLENINTVASKFVTSNNLPQDSELQIVNFLLQNTQGCEPAYVTNFKRDMRINIEGVFKKIIEFNTLESNVQPHVFYHLDAFFEGH